MGVRTMPSPVFARLIASSHGSQAATRSQPGSPTRSRSSLQASPSSACSPSRSHLHVGPRSHRDACVARAGDVRLRPAADERSARACRQHAAGRRLAELIDRVPAVLDPSRAPARTAAARRRRRSNPCRRATRVHLPCSNGWISGSSPAAALRSSGQAVAARRRSRDCFSASSTRSTDASRSGDLRDYQEDERAAFALSGQDAHLFDHDPGEPRSGAAVRDRRRALASASPRAARRLVSSLHRGRHPRRRGGGSSCPAASARGS